MSILHTIREVKTCTTEEEVNQHLIGDWLILQTYTASDKPHFLLGRTEYKKRLLELKDRCSKTNEELIEQIKTTNQLLMDKQKERSIDIKLSLNSDATTVEELIQLVNEKICHKTQIGERGQEISIPCGELSVSGKRKKAN